MGTQVNNLREKQALQAVKAYVDNQATAQVIRTETVLYTGADSALNVAHQLSGDISDYDELGFYLRLNNAQDGIYRIVPVGEIGTGTVMTDFNFEISMGAQWYSSVRVNIDKTNNAFTMITRQTGQQWTGYDAYVYKVTGIKYTVPETYSTTEQVVGTWIDGKALYRRVIEIPEVQAVDRNWTLLLTDPTFLNTIDKLISAKFLTPIGTHLPLDTKIQDGKFYLWVSPGGDRINTIIIEYTKTGGA